MSGQVGAQRRSRAQRQLDRDEWRLRQIAFQAAKLKAEVEEKTVTVNIKKDELDFYRVYPDKRFIAPYWLTEKTFEMAAKGLKYKYRIPEDSQDPEVPLLLFQRDLNTGEEVKLGEAGDLYCLTLHTYEGTVMEIHIIVESRTSVESRESWLYYSCFDIGHGEKAYTIPSRAWQNYLLYREDKEGVREELDTRLLFLAVGNREYIGGCTLENFKKVSSYQLKQMILDMRPGGTYIRPTTEEAELDTMEGDTVELLRMSPVYGKQLDKDASFFDAPYFHVRRRAVPRLFQTHQRRSAIDDQMLEEMERTSSRSSTTSSTRSFRSSRSSSRRRNRSRSEKFAGNQDPTVKSLPPGVQKLILDCLNPMSEDNVNSRNLGREIVEAALNSPRAQGNIPKSWKLFSGFTTPENEEADPQTPPGAEISVMEQAIDDILDAHNQSELEAMGGIQVYVDDLNKARNCDTEDPSLSTTNCSLISGLEILKVTLEEEESQDQRSAKGFEEIDISQNNEILDAITNDPDGDVEEPSGAGALSSTQVIPSGAEDDFGVEAEDLPFLFNDSIDLWLAKQVNESQIVTVETDDSALMSDQEVRLTAQEREELERSFPEGFLDEDMFVVGFNLTKFM